MKPSFVKYLVGGLIAGVVAAVINVVYFFIFTRAAGYSHPLHPSAVSATVSSIFPCVLAAIGYWLLARFIGGKATAYYAIVVVLFVVAMSIFGFAVPNFPEGDPKPANFNWLVQPMHLVVLLAAVFITPWWVGRSTTGATP